MTNENQHPNQPVGGPRQNSSTGERWICLTGFTNARHMPHSVSTCLKKAPIPKPIRFNLVSRLATVWKRLAILRN